MLHNHALYIDSRRAKQQGRRDLNLLSPRYSINKHSQNTVSRTLDI